MAGVQAGRLEIEIVAEIARLQADLDKAKRAVKAASGDIAVSAKAANDNLRSIGQTGKMTAFQARNMAFQFQDLGVQMAMAAQSSNPLKMGLMAIAMQGPQITSIMKEAGMSAGDLAKNMAQGALSFARAHPVLIAVTTAIGAAAGGLAIFTNEVEKSAKLDQFAKGLGLTKDEMEKLGPVGITAGDAIKGLWKTISDGLGLDAVFSSIADFAGDAFKKILNFGKIAAATIYGSFFGAYRGITAVWDKLPAVLGEAAIGAANIAITAVEALVNRAIDALNSMIAFANPLLTAAKMVGINVGAIGKVTLGRLNNPYAGAGADAGKAFAGGFNEGFKSALTAADKFIDTWEKNTIDAAKTRISKKAGEIIDDRTAKAAGGKAGKAAGEEFAKEYAKFAAAAMDGLVDTMREAKETWASDAADDLAGVWEQLRKNQKARTQGAIDEAEAQARLNEQLRDLVRNLDQLGGMGSLLGDIGAIYSGIKTGDFSGVRGPAGYLMQQLSGITWTSTDKNGERITKTLGDTFSKALDKVFGTEGTFSKLLQGAGMGVATGQLIFGGNNKGAQIGGALGGAAGFAFGGPAGAAIGSLIGSGIGAGIGKLFEGKKPSIPGIVIGGLLGGIPGAILGGLLFGKTKWGTASLSSAGAMVGGNDKKSTSNASTAGDAISTLLGQLAAQLGGSLGDYNVSIGQYKNKWRVSTTGRTGKLETKYRDVKDFGKEGAEAAVRYALMDAIADGAIAGIRESTKRILLAGKDLDTQLQKALKFQGVFDELKASTDPLGAALDGINKRFNELRSIFAEAGASAEEYAQLEQLLAIKRQEAADEARAAMVDKVRDPIEMQIRILELLGKEEDALAASRLLELAGLKGTLQPLQTMIYQLEDAQKVIATFEPLAEDLKAFRKELLGGQGEQSFGYIAAQFRTIAQAAANGDATALGQLRGAAGNYLDAAMANAGSDLEYRRALGTVLASVDSGIFAAETQVDYAQAQIDAINNSANILASLKEELATLQTQIVENTGTVARMWQRFEVNGLPVITNPAEPIQVEVVNQ